MKVLFVLEYYYPHIGGVEVLFQTLAEGLVKKGHEVTVYTTRLEGYKSFEVYNGVKIIRKKIPFNSRMLFSFFTIFDILKLSKKFDIIHTTTYNASLPALLGGKINKKPVIITFHEVLGKIWFNLPRMNYFKALTLYFTEQLVLKRNFDKIIAVSYYTKNSLRLFGVKDEKLKTIYNFSDEEFFDKKKYLEKAKVMRKKYTEKHLFLAYGRPGVTKGFEYLIEGYKKLLEEYEDVKLVLLISKSPKEGYEHLIKLIKKYSLEGKVEVLDPVPRKELGYYLTMADYIVIPSITEGFGFTTVEASLLEKKKIVTNICSIPEVVFGKTIFIEPSNSEEIKKGMIKAIKNEFIEIQKKEFSKQKFIEEYEEEYKKLLKKN